MRRDESVSRLDGFDEICEQFRRRWDAGEPLRIETLLAKNASADRSRLLHELLSIELERRCKNDESPTADDYVARFPEDVDIVSSAFATMLQQPGCDAIAETIDVSQIADDETCVPVVGVADTEPKRDLSTLRESVRFGDYELISEIARGGMGVVYKARQTKLNRVVALKTIKTGELAGRDEVQRFYAEAEAAAQLDHPNIVPIFEVGEHEGQCFFSMGFVDGQGLDAHLKDGPLPPRDAAGLVRRIAGAVQYAHDQGIVHRDLKPANVLLAENSRPTESERAAGGLGGTQTAVTESQNHTARTETFQLDIPRITDFGLAKNTAADSELTATGQVLGTPSYMPPEQAAGKIDEIGPLADVYSLGAVMYATLTGRPPFQSANVLETLKQVLERDPVSPRELNPAVDKDLETICLKCLEKGRAKRYASAGEFADDLTRYLDGKPILARPIGRLARVWRWCRRNPTGAAVVALLLFLAVAGPSIAFLQFQTNARLDMALEGETAQRKKAELNEKKARESERKMGVALAGEQAALARKNKALVETEAAIDRYVQTVKDSRLLREPRFKELLRILLKDALAHYRHFVEEHREEQDEPTRARLAQAFFEIAHISADKGSTDESIKAYRQALEIYSQLSHHNPHKREYQNSIATTQNNIGGQYAAVGNTVSALAAYKKARAIWQKLSQTHSNKVSYQSALASVHLNIGIQYRAIGKPKEALAAYQQARTMFRRLQRDEPTSVMHRFGLAKCGLNIGLVEREIGMKSQALKTLLLAMSRCEQLVKEHLDVSEFSSSLAASHHHLGSLYRETGAPEKAISAFAKSVTILEQLARDNPTVSDYRWRLAGSQNNLGRLYSDIGRISDALKAFRQTQAIWKQLVRENSSVDRNQIGLAASHQNLGLLYESMGNLSEALKSYRQAHSIREKLAKQNPNVDEHQANLADSHNSAGMYAKENGQPEVALQELRRALAIRQQLVRRNPQVSDHHCNLADSYHNIGNLYSETRRPNEALTAYRQAVAIFEELVKLHPGVRKIQFHLAGCLRHIGDTYRATGRSAAAMTAYRQSVVISEKLIRKYPTVSEYQRGLAGGYHCMGLLYNAAGKTAQALAAFRQALEVGRKLALEHPLVNTYQQDLATHYNQIGNLHKQGGRQDEAMAAQQQGLLIREKLAKKYPSIGKYQHLLAISQYSVGVLHLEAGRLLQALKCFDQAITLSKRKTGDAASRRVIQLSHLGRAMTYDSLERFQEAVADWRSLLALDDGRLRSSIQRQLAFSLARNGKYAEATALAEQHLKSRLDAADAYKLACTFAVSASAVGNDRSLESLSRDRAFAHYATRAVAILKAVNRSGYFSNPGNEAILRTDPLLTVLRHRDDFREFAKSVGVKLPARARRPRSAFNLEQPSTAKKRRPKIGT